MWFGERLVASLAAFDQVVVDLDSLHQELEDVESQSHLVELFAVGQKKVD